MSVPAMVCTLLLALLLAAGVVHAQPQRSALFNEEEDAKLPEGFLFGASTSAIQVEGVKSWNKPYSDGQTGMPLTAADSVHRYLDDVKMAKELKLNAYRFSIAWPHVLPTGVDEKPNEEGVQYYRNLIDELLKNDIEPMVTMAHFDYPFYTIQQFGSWNVPSMVDAFVKYADFLFRTFGDKVKYWTTNNEANMYCQTSCALAGSNVYECMHNMVLAHAKVWHLYDKNYRSKQKGKVGSASLAVWSRPNSTSWDDIEASDRYNQFTIGAMYHPLAYGEYPPVVRERVDYYSKMEGRATSRLPHFTDEERELVMGAADFLSFNAYMGSKVAARRWTSPERPAMPDLKDDYDAVVVGGDFKPGPEATAKLMQADPSVLREAPRWIYKQYRKPILITENGWCDARNFTVVDPRKDAPRVGYHSEYIHEMVHAMEEDKVDIIGYMAWSLIDAWEWSSAYGRKFGLVHVDYENGTLERSLKESAWFFQYIGEKKRVPKIKFALDDDVPSSGSGKPSAAPFAALLLALLVVALLQ